MAKSLKPDVITMDIEMPEMDGLASLRKIMQECPTHVLMLSSLTTEGSHSALQALKLGAADVLAKDTSQNALSVTNMQEDLVTRVRALALAAKPSVRSTDKTPPLRKVGVLPNLRSEQFGMICIGSSTGGPPVLETVLTALPASFKIPIVVAQHMPEIFTKSMAERLDQACQLRVVHAHDGMLVEPGTIYIAPGGHHTHIQRRKVAQWELLVNNEPADALYKPGVDALLHSAAEHVGSRALAIVMTGIGNDGLEGGRALHAQGGVLIAQDEQSCVVYGMPKGITQEKLVVASLCPEEMAAALKKMAGQVDSSAA